MTTSPAPDSARRNEKARIAILTAAYELVTEVGYASLTMEGIAARAGVGKQTIYRWWRSKGTVLLEAFLMLSLGPEDEPMHLPDSGELEHDLIAVLSATVDELVRPEYDRPLRALTVAILDDAALAAEYIQYLDLPTRRAKAARLKSAQAVGQLPKDLDLDVAIDTIFSPLAQRWLLRTGPLTHEYAEMTVRNALRGLRANKSEL